MTKNDLHLDDLFIETNNEHGNFLLRLVYICPDILSDSTCLCVLDYVGRPQIEENSWLDSRQMHLPHKDIIPYSDLAKVLYL